MDLEGLTVDEVATLCAEEAKRFRSGEPVESAHCFELFRRALRDEDSAAFTLLYQTYEPQMSVWVRRHPRYSGTGEEAAFFVQRAMIRFYFALRGDSFERFDHVGKLLKYLKACIASSLMEYWRRETRVTLQEGDDGIERIPVTQRPDSGLLEMDLWARIMELLPEPRDQRLAHHTFAQGLKPAEIAREFPDEWSSARAVSVALYRIRGRLWEDYQIRQLLDLGPPT